MKQSMIELAKTMLDGQDKIARLADGSVDYAKLAGQLGIGKRRKRHRLRFRKTACGAWMLWQPV